MIARTIAKSIDKITGYARRTSAIVVQVHVSSTHLASVDQFLDTLTAGDGIIVDDVKRQTGYGILHGHFEIVPVEEGLERADGKNSFEKQENSSRSTSASHSMYV